MRYYQEIFEFIKYFKFENKINTEAYEKYLDFCKEKGFKPVSSKIAFSRYISKFENLQGS